MEKQKEKAARPVQRKVECLGGPPASAGIETGEVTAPADSGAVE
jgi:hypothetical protein